jgi:hypothetical protein
MEKPRTNSGPLRVSMSKQSISSSCVPAAQECTMGGVVIQSRLALLAVILHTAFSMETRHGWALHTQSPLRRYGSVSRHRTTPKSARAAGAGAPTHTRLALARCAAALLKAHFGASRVVVFDSLIHAGCFTRWSDNPCSMVMWVKVASWHRLGLACVAPVGAWGAAEWLLQG